MKLFLPLTVVAIIVSACSDSSGRSDYKHNYTTKTEHNVYFTDQYNINGSSVVFRDWRGREITVLNPTAIIKE